MTSDTADYVANVVARRIGVPVDVEFVSAELLRIIPAGIHKHEGFSVEIRTGWRHAEAAFVPGTFARPLIVRMGEAAPESRAAFMALAAEASRHGKLSFRLNGTAADPLNAERWPESWQRFELSLRKNGVVYEEASRIEIQALLQDLIVPIFGMIVCLIGVDDVEADESALEGDAIETLSRRYERKPINREICLSVRGRLCYCCGFDFAAHYGPTAKGFIEVHHKVPVAGMGPDYKVNPVAELFPVCSNCHSVIHLKKPALDPDVLRTQLASRPTVQ